MHAPAWPAICSVLYCDGQPCTTVHKWNWTFACGASRYFVCAQLFTMANTLIGFLISLQRDRAVDMSITTSVKWLVSQSELYPLGPITLGKSGRAAPKKCLTPTHVSIGLNWNSATRDWHTQEVKLFLASHATKQEWTGLCVWCHIKISPCWILDKERRSYRARFVKKMDEHNGFVSLLTEITRSLSSINVPPRHEHNHRLNG